MPKANCKLLVGNGGWKFQEKNLELRLAARTPREDNIQPHVSTTIYYATLEYKPHTHCSHHTFPSVFPTGITVTPVIHQRKWSPHAQYSETSEPRAMTPWTLRTTTPTCPRRLTPQIFCSTAYVLSTYSVYNFMSLCFMLYVFMFFMFSVHIAYIFHI
jgi:hypothetical protein